MVPSSILGPTTFFSGGSGRCSISGICGVRHIPRGSHDVVSGSPKAFVEVSRFYQIIDTMDALNRSHLNCDLHRHVEYSALPQSDCAVNSH